MSIKAIEGIINRKPPHLPMSREAMLTKVSGACVKARLRLIEGKGGDRTSRLHTPSYKGNHFNCFHWEMKMHRWDKWNPEQHRLEYLLVQDVKNLPIITRRSQELWLGIQIKSPQRWQSLLEIEDQAKLSTIYALLYDAAWELEKNCEKLEISPPDISQWILELLAGQRNIYELRHSKLRRFIRHITKIEENPDGIQAIIDLSYKCAELLAILPQKVLRYLSDFQRLPLPEVLEKQMIRRSFKTDYPQRAIYQQAKKAKHILVAGHSRYALRIAYRYVNQGVDYLDLVQAAFLGLIRAAKKFDYQNHTRFAIYASTWMWQKVKRTIANKSRVIRIPVHVRTQTQEIQEAYENFWEEKKKRAQLR